MHTPLNYRNITPLIELCLCNWAVVITGWMSNCPGRKIRPILIKKIYLDLIESLRENCN